MFIAASPAGKSGMIIEMRKQGIASVADDTRRCWALLIFLAWRSSPSSALSPSSSPARTPRRRSASTTFRAEHPPGSSCSRPTTPSPTSPSSAAAASNSLRSATVKSAANARTGGLPSCARSTVRASRMRATASACVALPPICTHSCVGPALASWRRRASYPSFPSASITKSNASGSRTVTSAVSVRRLTEACSTPATFLMLLSTLETQLAHVIPPTISVAFVPALALSAWSPSSASPAPEARDAAAASPTRSTIPPRKQLRDATRKDLEQCPQPAFR
mmetsp:Transcript_29650/g.70567  ORF Transcript_29650/g.70567 Transcript_29650/m.70567 type:complete len:278 (-) Transcript_29650:171-1004(-)